MSDPVKLMQEATDTIKAFKSEQEKVMEGLQASIKTTGEDAKAAVERAEAAAGELQKHSARLLDIEQKMGDAVLQSKAAPETLGQLVIKSDAFKQYAAGNGGKMTVKANTIIGQSGSPLENSSTIVAPQRLQGIIPGSSRLLRIRDALPQGVTTSNMVEYTRELLFTNNAAETNEGQQKPESVLTFEEANAPVKTIAHFIKVSKQVLSDAPALQAYIDNRMRYGVEYRIDSQLINGNGTNPNISGILDAGNYTAADALLTGDNALDAINKGIYKVYASNYAPTAIMLNPQDWGAIERIKVGSNDATYVVGSPLGILGPNLWGLPVIVSNAVPQGKYIVGAFDIATQVFNREGTVVELFEQDADNVQKNLLTLRAEARLALAIFLPGAIVSGNLSA